MPRHYDLEQRKAFLAQLYRYAHSIATKGMDFDAEGNHLTYDLGALVRHAEGINRRTAVTEVSFNRPGTYCLPLWVQDEQGNRDVDSCTVRVFSAQRPERVMPTIFVSHRPSGAVAVGRPVSFRCWLQGAPQRPVRLAFDDGRVLDACVPMSEVTHAFQAAGIHVVTATVTVKGMPIQQRQKVRVSGR